MILNKWKPKIKKRRMLKKKLKNLKLMIKKLKKIMKSQFKKIN